MLGVVRLVGPDAVADPEKLLEDREYFSSHLPLVTWSTLWFLAFALTSGALIAARWPNEAALQSADESAWIDVFNRTPQEEVAAQGIPPPVVKVEAALKNGSTYRGTLRHYTKDLEIADRELVLKRPLSRVNGDGTLIPIETPPWHRLILPAAEVTSILVLYEAAPSPISESDQATKGVSRWRTHPLMRGYRNVQGVSENLYNRRHEPLLLTQLLAVEFGGLLLWGLILRTF
jgi:hypothetical protein